MTIKTGRNDPCPCGSGKKFKQCCIGKEMYENHIHIDDKMSDGDYDRLFDEMCESTDDMESVPGEFLYKMVSLFGSFGENGPGFTTMKRGDFTCLLFYDPLKPVSEEELQLMAFDIYRNRYKK